MMKSPQKKTLWNKKYKLKNVRFGGSIQADRNLIASQEAKLSGLNDRLVAPSVEGTAALTQGIGCRVLSAFKALAGRS